MLHEKDKVYVYNPTQNKLLKTHKKRAFFYKKFGWFKKTFDVEMKIRQTFEYERIQNKYEILYSSPQYKDENLRKTKFFIEREIRDYENSKIEGANFSSFVIAFIAALFALIPVIMDAILSAINKNEDIFFDQGTFKYFFTFGMFFLIVFLAEKLREQLDKNNSTLKIKNKNQYDENLLRLECLKNEMSRRNI